MSKNNKPKIIVIGGPTASGKTDYAIEIAKEIGGEIVNADSRQVYKELNIGTNKGVLTPINKFIENDLGLTIQAFDVENSGITGWMFDLVYPNEEFNLSMYKHLAEIVIDDILSRGRVPVIVGGTGLYINAIIYNFNLEGEVLDAELRKKLDDSSVEYLQNKLKDIAPHVYESLNNSDANNPRRLIRHIEKEINAQNSKTKRFPPKYDYELMIPNFDKQTQHRKINARVIKMFKEGLVEETQKAINNGWGDTKIMKSMTYREVQMYVGDKINYDECVALVQLEHRKYAKRQITWFKKMPIKKRFPRNP